ncbi:MAG: hypothetical protein LKJ25_00905 [Clostridia bacterium]|jgi:hypothetical protein|nr:hypothetical protein [Clostridia bacterium]
MIRCCFNCKERKAGCHGTCSKYIEEAEKHANNKKKFKEDTNYNFVSRSQYMNAIYRVYRNNKKAHACKM